MNTVAELIREGQLELLKEKFQTEPQTLCERGDNGFTSIHWAAYFDEVDCVKLILSMDSSLKHNVSDRGMNAFQVSAIQNSVRVMNYFGDYMNESDVINGQNCWGETALHLCASQGNESALKVLVQMGCDQSLKDKWNRTAADVAIENGHQELAHTILNESYISSTDSTATSRSQDQQAGPLHNPTVIHEFMRSLAAKGSSGSTDQRQPQPTILVKHIFNEFIDVLPSATSDSSHSSPAVGSTASSSSAPSRGTAAADSADWRKIALSKRLEYPGDPVQLAAWIQRSTGECGDAESRERHERFLNGRDMFGLAALHKCASWAKTDLLALLLECPEVDRNACAGGPEGFTALHFAVEAGAARAVRCLLSDSLVDPHVRDKKGRTALELAAALGNTELEALLKESISAAI